MGWTAPATYSVSEIVLASKLNTHIRDNLNYLKGNAGAVAISDDITATLAGGASLAAEGTNNNSFARLRMLCKLTAGTVVDWRIMANAISGLGELSFYDATAALERMRITSGGNVGFGVVPEATSRHHVKGSIVNWVFWEGDAIDGTARTVLANGSALYAQAGFAITRPSNGATPNVLSLNATSLLGATLYSVASDQCLLTAGSGGYIVQRTSGSLTYKVALVFMTL